MKVTVGISNRHVHLTKETYEFLFGKRELECRNKLNQVGEYASKDTVDIEYNGIVLEHVRIVGPFRVHNQIELLGSDIEKLGINVPVRRSGDLENTPTVSICANGKRIAVDGVIRAERHVHVPTGREEELGLHERDKVRIVCPNASFYANIKVSENGYFELHIDKDEAEEYGLESGDEVSLELCGK